MAALERALQLAKRRDIAALRERTAELFRNIVELNREDILLSKRVETPYQYEWSWYAYPRFNVEYPRILIAKSPVNDYQHFIDCVIEGTKGWSHSMDEHYQSVLEVNCLPKDNDVPLMDAQGYAVYLARPQPPLPTRYGAVVDIVHEASYPLHHDDRLPVSVLNEKLLSEIFDKESDIPNIVLVKYPRGVLRKSLTKEEILRKVCGVEKGEGECEEMSEMDGQNGARDYTQGETLLNVEDILAHKNCANCKENRLKKKSLDRLVQDLCGFTQQESDDDEDDEDTSVEMTPEESDDDDEIQVIEVPAAAKEGEDDVEIIEDPTDEAEAAMVDTEAVEIARRNRNLIYLTPNERRKSL